MRRLRSYLYVGPGVIAPDVPLLQRSGITAVLSLQEAGVDLLAAAMDDMRRRCEPQIVFRNVAIRDYDPRALILALPIALAALHALVEDGRVVYLHCSEGINRSPSVALAYLVRHEHMPFDDALSELRRSHPLARPYDSVLSWLRAQPET